MRAHLSISAATFFTLLFLTNHCVAQCQYGGGCTGVPHGSGTAVPGAAGAAAGIFGMGMQMLLEQSMNPQGAVPPPATATPQSSGSASGNSEVTPSERANLLNQLRPLRDGAYGASDPGNATTSDAVPDQLQPIGVDGSAFQVQRSDLLQQMRPLDSPEPVSTNAGRAFDTAVPGGSPRTAADQLCQAAGKAAGCIGTSPPGRPAAAVAGSAPGDATVGAVAIGSATMVYPVRPVCGVALDVDRPIALESLGGDPNRAVGYPIASSLDELRRFDYSDIKANLAAMRPQQIAMLKVAALQEAARLETTLDVVRRRLFASELGANVPVPSYTEAAKEAIYESLKDAAPFWRQMEALGQGKPTNLEAVKGYLNQIENAEKERDILSGKLLRALNGLKDQPGLTKLTRAHAASTVEAVLAVDRASKGDKAGAIEHSGKAAKALLPATQWLVPAAARPTLVRSQAYLTVALIAIDVGERGYSAYDATAQVQKNQSEQASAALDLGSRVDALKGKLRDVEKLQDLIAQEPRCI